jgi:hypothetical protein
MEVHSTTSKPFAEFPDITLLVSHHHTPQQIGGEFLTGKHVLPLNTELHYKSVCKTKFSISLQEHINLSPEQYLNG